MNKEAKAFLDEAMAKEPMIGLGNFGMSALSRIPFVIHPAIHRLMDEYAKQEAIGFAEWIAEKGYKLRPYHGWINMESENYYTDNQLYTIYLNQKGK
jgi:hypothetical protein